MPRVTPDPALPVRLAPITLTDAAGVSVRLGDLWGQRTRVLVHLRHFG